MLNNISGLLGDKPVIPYSTTVLQDSPRGFWLMNETSGSTFADTSGVGPNNATIYNSPTLNQAGPSAALSKSVSFNGSTQYARTSVVSTFAIAPSANWSVEGWFKTGATALQSMIYVGNLDANSSGMLTQIGVNSDNKAFATLITNGPGFLTITSTATFNDNAWHYLAVTSVSGGVVNLYVDGTSVASTSTARRTTAVDACVNIGSQIGQYYFNGNVTGAAVYNTTLSSTRITAHYNAGK